MVSVPQQVPPPPSCESVVEEAVRAAGRDRLDEAERLLESVLERCSGYSGLLRELAGLRFRQDRFAEAGRLASRFVEFEPESAWGWNLLASSRYLSDDPLGALAAWNRVGRPTVREIRIDGGSSSGAADVGRIAATRLGLSEGDILTPDRLALGARRIEQLPAVSSSRLSYRPVSDGRVDVEGVIVTGPRHPFARLALPGHVLRMLGGSVRLEGAGALGRLEHWTVEGAMDGDLYAASARLSHPAPGAGIWSWEVRRQSGRYRIPDGPSPDHLESPAPPDLPVTRVPRSGVRWRMEHLPTSWAHGGVTVGVDHWHALPGGSGMEDEAQPGTAAMVGLSLTLDLPKRSVTATVWSDGWVAGGVGSVPFGRTGVDAEIQPLLPGSFELDTRAGIQTLTRAAPLDLRPRFGSGRMATHPMRARSEFDPDGAVRADHPGPVWVHGGAELRWWSRARFPVTPGAALFADGVRSGRTLGGGSDGAIHLGIGLRGRVPGVDGWFRLDWAIDPADGASQLSAAWVQPSMPRPPGRRRSPHGHADRLRGTPGSASRICGPS
jgi:hypothetical protein